jgi:Sec-independent protein secretion pathway component TatC
MIKLEDNVSVVIICVITFMAIFYSFMFLGDNFAAAFMERTGNPAPNEATLFWMGSWGYIYLSLAVGNIMALLVPASESRVYFPCNDFPCLCFSIKSVRKYNNC